ncbi:MAG: ATP-binding protein [Bacteroidales bacterium]|nr:ATP-binding protein [Bacteroidales bacterium]
MSDKISILKKYNFWDKNITNYGFIRKYYLSKIQNYLSNKLIKVLVGQRRSGKSYILRQIMRYLKNNNTPAKNILYINKEFTDFDFIQTHIDLSDLINLYIEKIKPEGKIYLFVDEIQNINSWEKTINSFSQDYTREFEIFITGSNSELLAGELSTYLSGRYVEFQILPFSYIEYITFAKLQNTKQSFLQYLNSGGLPELFNLSNEETKRHYVTAVKDTILLRDIIQRYKIKDAKLLEDIFSFLINNASNLISINNIVNYYKSKNKKTSYETIANYINYLKNSFLIHQAEKYNISGKKTLAGSFKFYINDLSYKNYIYAGFAYGIGYKLENLVYLQLINAGFDVYVGYLRNKEVDFVAIKNAKPIYIQVTYLMTDEKTIDREYRSLESINDNFPKIVISLDDIILNERNGIKHIQAWNLSDFIKK